MDSLLNISSSKRNTEVQEEHSITVTKTSEPRIKSNRNPATSTFSNATEILGILKDQPSFESLRSCLKLLIRQNEGFDIKTPGPISTQIIAVLVGNIIPNYWTVLQDDIHLKERQWLLKCLAIVAGIGALIARLKFLQNSGKKSEPACSPTHGSKSVEVLEVLDAILNQDLVLSNIWTDLSIHVKKPVQRQILWKELISLLASGRLISVAAEALTLLEDRESKFSWLGESSAFTTWLGTNIRKLALMSDKHGNDLFAPAAVMLSRALSLGHNGMSFQDLIEIYLILYQIN